jgi:glucose dehydrogenase
VGILVTGCLLGSGYAAESQASDTTSPDDWPYVNHDNYGTRYNSLDSINPGSAKRLKRACTYTFPDKEPSQTAPIAIAGVLYASTGH